MVILGVLSGLWAAFFQSLSYLATRHFVQSRGRGSRVLMTLAHVLMGVVCVCLLPFVFPWGQVSWAALLLPLLGTTLTYLLGQFGLILALRHAQPSQVTPMLALKLIVLAGLTCWISHESLGLSQWLAIGCCLGGTFVLNYSRDRLPTQTLLLLVATCLFYALSDWSIKYFITAFGSQVPYWKAIASCSALCYTFCGVVALPFLARYGSRDKADWQGAAPYAATWMLGMFGLFTCFGLMGVVYGNILQSTRSIMGVFMAAILTRLGHHHIEHMQNRAMFARRLVAAALMTLAAVLWLVK
jgi:hypothetical protein